MPNTIQLREYSKGSGTRRNPIHFVQNRNGNLNVPYLYENGGKVVVNWNWLDNNWNSNNPALRFGNSFHFSLVFIAGEFCFASCPLQPPSIFPISSTFTDKARYFLLSIDFASHKTIKSILRVSVFLIASRTHGCFSSRDKKVAIEIASITSTNKVSIFCPRVYLWIFGKVS